MVGDKPVGKKELAACFWAALLATGLLLWLALLAFFTLRPTRSEGWLLVASALVAWFAAMHLGFRAPAPSRSGKVSRVVLVGVLAAITTAIVVTSVAAMFRREEQAFPVLAITGALLCGLFRVRALRQAGPRPRDHRLREAAAWTGAVSLTVLLGVAGSICVGAWIRYGVVLQQCPDGKILQNLSVSANGLRRGVPGTVTVRTSAIYTVAAADSHVEEPVKSAQAKLFLVDGQGVEKALPPERGTWSESRYGDLNADITLPTQLPDGDYLLRAKVTSRIGDSSIDAPLGLYAPARIHVLTDRPLYEPGNKVEFRAVVLRATDYLPLDARPGRWQVEDPSGELVLEEKTVAGQFGVVAGSFPLDPGAETGNWKVRWVSGANQDEVTFRVEPFTLPRFRVEATPARPFHGKGDRPVLRGKVVYTSGAPVSGAAIEIDWAVASEPAQGGESWPAPAEWEEGGLPKTTRTTAAGTFELFLPAVPQDLRGRVNLRANVSAIDPTGDRATTSATVLLSEDALEVVALTELDGGLVQGFNNRLYLRVLGAGGDVLAGAQVLVKQAWNPNDEGVTAETDADGVAALQIDPGAPVNIVIAPMPMRRAPRAKTAARVERSELKELITGETPSLQDQRAMDGWNKGLLPCARFASDEEDEEGAAKVALRVNASGSIVATAPAQDRLSKCVAQGLSAKRLPPGADRLYEISFTLQSDLPELSIAMEASPGMPGGLGLAIRDALSDARTCVPKRVTATSLPRVLVWSAKPDKKSLSLSFVRDPDEPDDLVSPSVASCIERKLLAVKWSDVARAAENDNSDSADGESLGVGRMSVFSEGEVEEEPPGATTMLGYELSVTATAGGKEIGSTTLLLKPGNVPPIRLRATPVLARSGEKVVVKLLRGPDYTGALPEKLYMSHRNGRLDAKLDTDELTATFKLPGDARGWFEVTHDGGRALVFVRPLAQLAVTVKAGAERYAPGDLAELQVRTTAGNRPTAAAVGLFGVDASLAQLAKLPAPDDLARLRPMPTMRTRAFGVLDATALEMGRIRGGNAAAATVLHVAELPAPAELDVVAETSATTSFEPLVALTDNFYRVMGELQDRVRAWESAAPRAEKMRPATMAKLWDTALQACEKRKQPVEDAFGRRLRLGRLPHDLLALVDPRQLVIDGKRLPEDVESWIAWVQKEQP